MSRNRQLRDPQARGARGRLTRLFAAVPCWRGIGDVNPVGHSDDTDGPGMDQGDLSPAIRADAGSLNELSEASRPETEVVYVVGGSLALTKLQMINAGSRPCTFGHRRHRTSRRGTLVLPRCAERGARAELAHRWQWSLVRLFAVSRDASASLLRRFAGRVENSADSISDPAMGGGRACGGGRAFDRLPEATSPISLGLAIAWK